MMVIRIDLIMETISALISFSVAYFAMKAYKLTGNKSLMYLYYGFSILGAGMLTRVFATSYIIMIARGGAKIRGLIFSMSLIYGLMRTLAYTLFTLAYIVRTKSIESIETAIIAPLILNPYFEFIQIALLIYITAQSAMNYLENRNINSLLIFTGFLLILISHLTFMYSIVMKQVYIIAHLIQLLGFTCMLLMLVKVGR